MFGGSVMFSCVNSVGIFGMHTFPVNIEADISQGKYRFDIAKREKEAKKNQKVIETKEIRLGLSIDKHDFETKGNHAIQFLKAGNKLKVSIRFRGRELGHPEIGLEIMQRFADYCQEYAVVEKPAKMESRNMLMFLAPKPVK